MMLGNTSMQANLACCCQTFKGDRWKNEQCREELRTRMGFIRAVYMPLTITMITITICKTTKFVFSSPDVAACYYMYSVAKHSPLKQHILI